MTPEQIKKIRKELGLSQTQLAEVLRLNPKNGGRTVRNWESGRIAISGPASLALEFIYERSGEDV